tara:strand:- start:460 stop:855 length:396 start_codon:yes stop_codon:yes gene_type:complete
MRIIETNSENHKLLFLNLFKKEKMIIRLKTKQGIDLESKVITGNRFGVSSQDEIVKLIKELLYKALKQQLLISEIEVVHTHQKHKLSSGYWRIGEFSQRDLESAMYLKNLFNITLKLIIVSATGFSMEKSF